MAVFRAFGGFDVETFITGSGLAEFFSVASPSGGADQVTYTDIDGGITETVVFDGSFSNFVDGSPTSGTINTISYAITGGTSFSFSGLAMSVEEFLGYIEADNLEGLFAALFAGADIVSGSSEGDTLAGFDGNDILRGGDGGDTLYGGAGADKLNGQGGDDSLFGGAGDDIFLVGSLGDTLTEFAGEGTDEVYVFGVDFVLTDNVENLRIRTGGALDATGNALDNKLFGLSGANVLKGLGGNDYLDGKSGADTLIGGAGRDRLVGALGQDTMKGGSDADRFIFQTTSDSSSGRSSADIITDFSQADGDRIQLSAIDAISGGADDAFSFVGEAAFSGTSGELRYFHDNGGDTIVQLDVNGDAVADMTIRLTGTIDLLASDFVL